MPTIQYETWKPTAESRQAIARANAICQDFMARGYSLTLRQIYYQFVSRDWIPNKQREYDKLGEILSKARLAGFMDWGYMEDRTRNLRKLASWASPSDIINSAMASYHRDHWAGQPECAEVWVEKDALVGVLENVCNAEDVPYFSCRGYTSQSELWAAAQRLIAKMEDGKRNIVVYHLGDHDPSGLQMTEDIQRRLELFIGTDAPHLWGRFSIKRIALNMDQIEQYNPPPNPAKASDSRYQWYVDKFDTDESWELDALDPDVIAGLVRAAVRSSRKDADAYAQVLATEKRERALLDVANKKWHNVAKYLEDNYGHLLPNQPPASTSGGAALAFENNNGAWAKGDWAYEPDSNANHRLHSIADGWDGWQAYCGEEAALEDWDVPAGPGSSYECDGCQEEYLAEQDK